MRRHMNIFWNVYICRLNFPFSIIGAAKVIGVTYCSHKLTIYWPWVTDKASCLSIRVVVLILTCFVFFLTIQFD